MAAYHGLCFLCQKVWSNEGRRDICAKKMAAEGGSWHEEVEKLCEDEDLMAAVADRSIFSLDDINLDDIFLDIKDADISGFVADNPQAGLVASGNLHGSAAASVAVAVDASAAGSAVLPEGLLVRI